MVTRINISYQLKYDTILTKVITKSIDNENEVKSDDMCLGLDMNDSKKAWIIDLNLLEKQM